MNIKLPLSKNQARLRHGGYAALVTILVLAALVLLNLVVGQLPVKLDLSSTKMYSISEQSRGFLKGLKEDITIYGLFKPGEEPANVVELLKRYRDASPRIRLEFLDVEKSPAFAKKYDATGSGLKPGSIVVVDEKSGRFKAIPYADLYEFGVNQQTGQQQVQGIAIEQRVTGAIGYAAGGKTAVVYQLAGHAEFTLEEIGLTEDLERENNAVKSLNLMTARAVPEDADLVLVISPKTDLLPGEAEALKRYLDAGGNALFLIDRMKARLENLEGVINLYGVATTQGFVLEGDESRMAAGRPNLILPELKEHEILASLKEKQYTVTMLNTQALAESVLKKRALKLTPLLESSPGSWLRTDLRSDSPEKIASDRPGPLVLAYAVEAPKNDPKAKGSRVAVAGSSPFVIASLMSQYMGSGNKELFLNMVSWSENRSDGLSIRPKSTFRLPLSINGLQALVWVFVIVILVPGAILAVGIVVWVRRRHR
jgi:ABC-2 type transport system permease protein